MLCCMQLTDFEEMWLSPGRFALVRVDRDEAEGSVLLPVVDLDTKAAALINEDDALAEAVVRRMVDEGVPVLDELPW
jgi:hypothetical protein